MSIDIFEKIKENEHFLFFKKMFKNPRRLGAVAPSSQGLADKIIECVDATGSGFIVEVGAGTGRFTESLLNSGVDPQRLVVIELDLELCSYLRKKFPQLNIVQANALDLESVLLKLEIYEVDSIISGIPLVNLSVKIRQQLFQVFTKVLANDGAIIQFTYGFFSPIRYKKMGLQGRCAGVVMKNIPPATVWTYSVSKSDIIYEKSA
ncbi:MAG: hypothetical protein C0432_00805 [Candidatus Puniceispirillum sp.]|nr:hypothetical protein [Candidatus Pelagibacter sp.]MBA4282821.1 hypothetical protein [Candidatus Puniceispirillum sp.]